MSLGLPNQHYQIPRRPAARATKKKNPFKLRHVTTATSNANAAATTDIRTPESRSPLRKPKLKAPSRPTRRRQTRQRNGTNSEVHVATAAEENAVHVEITPHDDAAITAAAAPRAPALTVAVAATVIATLQATVSRTAVAVVQLHTHTPDTRGNPSGTNNLHQVQLTSHLPMPHSIPLLLSHNNFSCLKLYSLLPGQV